VYKERSGDPQQAKRWKIVKVEHKEPTLFPNTHWQSLRVQQHQGYETRSRLRQNQNAAQESDINNLTLMNFWELFLEEDSGENFGKVAKAFTEEQKVQLQEGMDRIVQENIKLAEFFMEKVSKEDAPDYRYHIPFEVYLTLISSRLQHGFYRTKEVIIVLNMCLGSKTRCGHDPSEFIAVQRRQQHNH